MLPRMTWHFIIPPPPLKWCWEYIHAHHAQFMESLMHVRQVLYGLGYIRYQDNKYSCVHVWVSSSHFIGLVAQWLHLCASQGPPDTCMEAVVNTEMRLSSPPWLGGAIQQLVEAKRHLFFEVMAFMLNMSTSFLFCSAVYFNIKHWKASYQPHFGLYLLLLFIRMRLITTQAL